MDCKCFQYYTTFGSPMPMRTWSDPNAKYKYGFNGKEKDNEVNVDGGDYDFGARIYDSRLGRWLRKARKRSTRKRVSSPGILVVLLVTHARVLVDEFRHAGSVRPSSVNPQ